MIKAFGCAFLLALAGCAATPGAAPGRSPCDQSEASHACQIERYSNVN